MQDVGSRSAGSTPTYGLRLAAGPSPGFYKGVTVIKVLEQAIDKVRTLSAQRQQYAAEVLERIAAAGDAVYQLTDEERGLVREGLADLDAGRIVSDADMASFWDRHRA